MPKIKDDTVIDRDTILTPKRDTILKPKTDSKPKIQKPSMYKVIFHNDDYTPMDFVVIVLQKHFRKSIDEATNIMMEVHLKGKGIAGLYTFEIAEQKSNDTMNEARKNGFPLRCSLEKE